MKEMTGHTYTHDMNACADMEARDATHAMSGMREMHAMKDNQIFNLQIFLLNI